MPIGVQSTNGTTVTVTAEFAGRTDSAEVEVLPSSLVLELANPKFALGVDTLVSSFIEVVGPDALARSSAQNVTEFESDNDAAVGGIQISTFESDNNPNGLPFGAMRATSLAAGLTSISSTITAKVNLGTDAAVSPCNALTASVDVVAEEHDRIEIVPDFVSTIGSNQSSDGNLFLASNTGARVSMNAVFADGQRQALIAQRIGLEGRVTWELDDNANTANQLSIPADGSGLVVADDDDFNISPAPVLTATFVRGDADADQVDGDLPDLTATLAVNITDYAQDDIALAYEPTNGGIIPFSASTPYQVIATFNDDDDMPELVLDVSTSLSLSSDDGNDEDSSNLFDFIALDLITGTVGSISKDVADNVDENGDRALTSEHRVTVSVTVDPDTNDDDGTDTSVTADNPQPSTAVYTLGDSDLENIQPDDTLQIALVGETQAIADGASICIEEGSSQQFDALVQFANESGSSVLSALVTIPAIPTPGALVMPNAVWSITNPGSFVVSNSIGNRGRVTVVGAVPSSATLTASYVNLTPNSETEADRDENGRIARRDTLQITSAADCSNP